MYSRLSAVLITMLVIFGLAGVAGAQLQSRCQIIGTDGDDVITGTAGNDVLCGLGGDDVINGRGGDDVIIGGSGDDTLFGAAGSDELRGGEGSDRVIGGAGNDVVRGGNGDDELAGGSGDDELWGGNGDDHLRGARGADVLYGGSGSDVVRGGGGSDRLRGGPDADVCVDSFGGTNALTCEFGNGGEGNEVVVARALWERRGNSEFVYSITMLAACVNREECGAPANSTEVVHVRMGFATSGVGAQAFSADELFDVAAEASAADRTVRFDPGTGLPQLIRLADGTGIAILDVAFRDDLRERIEQARNIWGSADVSDYSFTVKTTCFCAPSDPIRVSVADGVVVAADGLHDGVERAEDVQTIDQYFEDILTVLDGHAIEIHATFDEAYGIPLSYFVDQSRSLADEERAVSIADFQVDALVDGGGPAFDEHLADEATGVVQVVAVDGIEVASTIADQVRELIDAATADGLTLGGGGFRDPQRQIDLRRANCGASDFAIFDMPADQCTPPTARPGASQHELGLAIDFTSAGRLITTRADPAFLWLAENGATYGMINLPAEPWHWSTTGN